MAEHGFESQLDLAKAIGTSQPVVSDWINGRSFPSESSRKNLAKLRGETLTQYNEYLDEGDKPETNKDLPSTASEALPLLRNLDWEETSKLIKLLLDRRTD